MWVVAHTFNTGSKARTSIHKLEAHIFDLASMKAPCESFGDFFFILFFYLTWVVGGYNLTRYPVFPAGTEIRRVIGLCIERSGSASPSSTSLESSTPSAPSNSPIGHLKIAQLHTVFHICVFNFFFCSPCCSPRDTVQFLFLALGSVNKTAQPYLAIPKCMQFFCYLLGCSGQNQVAAIVRRFCAVRVRVWQTVPLPKDTTSTMCWK